MARVTLVQVGIGTVGGAVIEQIVAGREAFQARLGVEVRVGAVVTTAGAVVPVDGEAIPDALLLGLAEARRAGTVPTSLTEEGIDVVAPAAAIDRLADAGPVIVVDTGAGDATAPLLAGALAQGGGVVLANKAPLALPADDPHGVALWAETGPRGRVRYEATCGAGLPVLSTLRTLLDTGDTITEIQGTLSGTLGAIFSDVAAGQPFAEAVRSAKAKGYTEPDPRDDLSGLDVARKALILARTIGRTDDLADMTIESLVPEYLAGGDTDVPAFLRRIGERDEEIAARAAEAKVAGATLKYVATVGPQGPLSVGVRAVPLASVLGALQGPENIVAFRTGRYDPYPLAVSGPGAGAAVTAAGVIGDILALAGRLAG